MSSGECRRMPPSLPVLNVLMLGAPGAGAKTFAERTSHGPGPLPNVDQHMYAYMRADFTVATVYDLLFLGGSNAVKFRLWDMPGRRFSVLRTDVRNAHAVIALYDVTSDKGLEVAVRQLTQASEALRSIGRDPPMFLVANKCDLLPPGNDSPLPGIENGALEAARLGVEFARSSSGPTPHVEQLLSRVVAAVYSGCPNGGGARLPFRPPTLTPTS